MPNDVCLWAETMETRKQWGTGQGSGFFAGKLWRNRGKYNSVFPSYSRDVPIQETTEAQMNLRVRISQVPSSIWKTLEKINLKLDTSIFLLW